MVSSTGIEDAGLKEAIRLRNVFLHVTQACNLRCRYCYLPADGPLPNEMSAEEIGGLWPDLVTLRPRKVVFTGGEPLLRPDLLDLLRTLREVDPKHQVLRCVNTNGHLVTPELAQQFVGLVDEVRVSLDALRERNDSLRGRGNFEAAVGALDCFYAVGFEPIVLVTVTSVSLPDLEALICFLIEKNIYRIHLNGFRPVGRGEDHWDWLPETARAQLAMEQAWKRCFPDQPEPIRPPAARVPFSCGVGSFLNIMPNGDVYPCHALTDPMFRAGNVRQQRLSEIWTSAFFGNLAAIDLRELPRQEGETLLHDAPNRCMGIVYARTKWHPFWGQCASWSPSER
jgi:MoaA/NifB/PqqE/SkfB family radical SAM enzyme